MKSNWKKNTHSNNNNGEEKNILKYHTLEEDIPMDLNGNEMPMQ